MLITILALVTFRAFFAIPLSLLSMPLFDFARHVTLCHFHFFICCRHLLTLLLPCATLLRFAFSPDTDAFIAMIRLLPLFSCLLLRYATLIFSCSFSPFFRHYCFADLRAICLRAHASLFFAIFSPFRRLPSCSSLSSRSCRYAIADLLLLDIAISVAATC